MEGVDRDTIEHLRTWLSNRGQSNDSSADHYHSNVVIHPPTASGDTIWRTLALPPNLHLNRYTRFAWSPSKQQQQQPISPQSRDTQLGRTLGGLSRLITSLRSLRGPLELLEYLRLVGSSGETAAAAAPGRTLTNKDTAAFNVDECIELIQTAQTLGWALDIQIDQLDFVPIEDSSPSIQNLVARICALLFSSSPARLVAKSSHYSTCLLAAFLVDLFHQAGFSRDQLQLFVYDYHQRDATSGLSPIQQQQQQQPAAGAKWLFSYGKPKQKQSLVAICFADTHQIVAALKSIFTSYVRELGQHSNLILFIEEANYDTFYYHWSSEASSEKFMKPLEDLDLKIDLNCIDIRQANRMTKPCINVIKFRSLADLQSLMGKLRKTPYIQLWSGDHLFGRQVALGALQETGQCVCEEFWLNQLRPANIAGHRFGWQMIRSYRKFTKMHMDGVYTNIFHDFEERLCSLRERASKFRVSPRRDRLQLITRSYIGLVSKFKSMKPMSLSVGESLNRLQSFCSSSSTSLLVNIENQSETETILRPVGVAILVIKSEQSVRHKSVIVEFIFKNLMLGNGVMLVCPAPILGGRFLNELLKLDSLPFDWVDPRTSEDLATKLDVSAGDKSTASVYLDTETSWDSMDSGLNTSIVRKQLKCPKDTYAVEYNQRELTSDRVDLLILALGAKRSSIWYPTPTTTTTSHSSVPDSDYTGESSSFCT